VRGAVGYRRAGNAATGEGEVARVHAADFFANVTVKRTLALVGLASARTIPVTTGKTGSNVTVLEWHHFAPHLDRAAVQRQCSRGEGVEVGGGVSGLDSISKVSVSVPLPLV
jgi:hypothetical protein